MTDTPGTEDPMTAFDDLAAELIDEEDETDESTEDGEGDGEPETPDDAPDGEPDEQADDGEPDAPALPMPTSWGKDDAEAWAAMSPAAQAVVARREAERDNHLREQGRKASETRHTVENEARETLAKIAENYAEKVSAYARQFAPQPPDQRLLYTGAQDDVLTYQRQDAAYRAATAQQQELHQEAERAQQQASEARRQAEQQEIAVDAGRLKEQLPEWFDPSAGPKLQQELQSIGAELGYTAELMAQAGSTDIIALKKAAEWKAKADKLDALNAKMMEGVRAAKGLPKIAKPGVTRGKPTQAAKAEKAWERTLSARTKEGRNEGFADFLEATGQL